LLGQLLNSRHTLDEVPHFDESSLDVLVSFFHPDFEDGSDAHQNSELSNDDGVEELNVDGQI